MQKCLPEETALQMQNALSSHLSPQLLEQKAFYHKASKSLRRNTYPPASDLLTESL